MAVFPSTFASAELGEVFWRWSRLSYFGRSLAVNSVSTFEQVEQGSQQRSQLGALARRKFRLRRDRQLALLAFCRTHSAPCF